MITLSRRLFIKYLPVKHGIKKIQRSTALIKIKKYLVESLIEFFQQEKKYEV
jgi:hypothetical protein